MVNKSKQRVNLTIFSQLLSTFCLLLSTSYQAFLLYLYLNDHWPRWGLLKFPFLIGFFGLLRTCRVLSGLSFKHDKISWDFSWFSKIIKHFKDGFFQIPNSPFHFPKMFILKPNFEIQIWHFKFGKK